MSRIMRRAYTYGYGATLVHRAAEKGWSRKLGFRYLPFSETRLPALRLLGNLTPG
jgi:hypothetical protein